MGRNNTQFRGFSPKKDWVCPNGHQNPISGASSHNMELFSCVSQCLKSAVVCDSRFQSQIAIAVKSRDLEHSGDLAPNTNPRIPHHLSRFTAESWEFPNLVVSNLIVCNSYAEALFCALLRSFALFCSLLRSFALFCARPRLERPRLGTAENHLNRNRSSTLLYQPQTLRRLKKRTTTERFARPGSKVSTLNQVWVNF